MKISNKFFGHTTINQSFQTITATILSGVLGLLFYMLVARSLGPTAFGLFSVAIATLALIADIGDLGTDSGLIRFIGKYDKQKDIQKKLLKLSIEVKILVWIFVLLVGLIFSEFIANSFFQKPQLVVPLRLAFVGVGGALFLSFSSHALQAFQKYKTWSAILVLANLFRLIFIVFLMFFLALNLQNALIIYIMVPFIFFLIGLTFLPNFFASKNEFSVSKEFFNFNRWIFILSIISAISSRVDTFLIARLLSLEQVGLYSAANQLTSFMPQLSFAIATVVAPKLTRFNKKSEVFNYVKKLQLFIFGLCSLGLLGIPVAYLIIFHLYGSKFTGSFIPFVILYLSQLVFLVALPIYQSIFYYFGKPQVFVPVTFLQLLIVIILCLILINPLGIVGASLAVLVGNVFFLIFPTIWAIREFRK